jgi:hypothetical protein
VNQHVEKVKDKEAERLNEAESKAMWAGAVLGACIILSGLVLLADWVYR